MVLFPLKAWICDWYCFTPFLAQECRQRLEIFVFQWKYFLQHMTLQLISVAADDQCQVARNINKQLRKTIDSLAKLF